MAIALVHGLVSALSTFLILLIGLATAWLLARYDWPGKSIIETLVSLPLVMPPVATGLILLKILGEKGAVGGFFYRHFKTDIAFTWRGVLIALAVMSFPLLVRSTRVAFEQVNPRLEQIARTLGASNGRVFCDHHSPFGVEDGVIGGMLLAFARALGEFGATIMVAGYISGRTATLSTEIYHSFNNGEDSHAYRFAHAALSGSRWPFLAVWSSELFIRRKKDAK